ncbi:hypothetical protein SEUCBS139899_001483 [Sporothrix eucalyptigena]|uniref:MFS maltose permease n=1 Tax=Sporothrix eucalyptigena TaxID=1812306 RepID=A0ABP0BKM1_9PEZI
MQPRPTILLLWPRRLTADRLAQDAGRRTFSFTQRTTLASGGHNWNRNGRTRPQLPFLVVPSTSAAAAASRSPRYFTTQRRQWLRYEALAFVKYTLYFWAAVGAFVLVQFVLQQESMERAHPTPHEWTFMSRMRLRGALGERGDDGSEEEQAASDGGDLDSTTTTTHMVDHVKVMQILLDLLKRLEDPSVDGGPGLVPANALSKTELEALTCAPEPASTTTTDNALGVSDALDIRAKSEPWRRGYYETLLAAAATAEHVDGWLLDRTRNTVFPPDIVVGPSNPHPRPLPAGTTGAPREENCEPVFPAPAEIYLKLLHTRGLTARQQITAALAFANYLEYKQDNDAAAYVYGKAVLASRSPASEENANNDLGLSFFDRNAGENAPAWIKSWTAQNHAANSNDASSTTVLSRNLFSTLTAYATFQARSGDVSGALPLFISLLQARRSLPPSASEAAASAAASRNKKPTITEQLIAIISPPTYPPPPDDGFGAPLPGARSTCEEAALRLHIGEILYASARKSGSPITASSSSWGLFPSGSQEQQAREQGIAWTREAVDIAEEQLHALAYSDQVEKRKEQQKLENGQGGISNAIGKAIKASTSTPPGSMDGAATCRQCLVAGLDNWTAMVAQLARDEQRRAQGTTAASDSSSSGSSWWPSWLGLWGSSEPTTEATTPSTRPTDRNVSEKKLGRWAAEECVIQDRRRRARELMDDAAPPSRGVLTMFTA